ncbi:hypothetical protein [Flavihumibacter solisilvae]|uniref:hypothetical protein n=1 Tax=Flavihumibacter solisilvae TaxID=1349421 RepID=UPI00069185BA|nr:hypothetical protein [Flavihumibacter solisilvae]
MVRFVKQLFAFLAFSIVAYVIFLIVWGTCAPTTFRKNMNFKMGGPGYMFTRLREADTVRNVDILFLGSSHAYRGYDPRIFQRYSLKAFNLGSSAQTPIETKILVDSYLEKIKPKHVVFDVYPVLFGNDGVESLLDIISNMDDPREIYPAALSTKNAKVYNTLIFNAFVNLIGKKKHFKEPNEKGDDTYVNGGYVATKKNKYKPEALERNYNQPTLTKQLEAFEAIISELKKRNITYTLVQAPVTQKTYLAFRKNEEMDKYFSEFGKYYNYSEKLKLGDSLFFDDSHLTQNGVEIFNEELVKQLFKDQVISKSNFNLLSKE